MKMGVRDKKSQFGRRWISFLKNVCLDVIGFHFPKNVFLASQAGPKDLKVKKKTRSHTFSYVKLGVGKKPADAKFHM